MNRPTAGKRSEKELPVGEHDLQLYSLGTPNGQKVTILLEELHDLKGLEYDAWKINIMELDQFGSGFVDINPNSKIPALVDRSFDPPLPVFETGSILKYVAEKHTAFVPGDVRKSAEVYNWLFWIHGAAPFLGGGAVALVVLPFCHSLLLYEYMRACSGIKAVWYTIVIDPILQRVAISAPSRLWSLLQLRPREH